MKNSGRFYMVNTIIHLGGFRMKKLLTILACVLLLCGCTPKAYTDNLSKGEDALKAGKYIKAEQYFKKAYEKKNTSEAKELINASGLLVQSNDALQTGDFEKSIQKAKLVNSNDSKNKIMKTAIKEAEKLIEKANSLLTTKKKMEDSIDKGKSLLNLNKFDEAYKTFKEAKNEELDNKEIKNLDKQLTDLMDQTTKERQAYDNNIRTQQQEKQKQNSNEVSSTPKENSNILTHSEAEQIVRSYLKITDKNVYTKYDHDEGDNYIIHVYEVVIDDPKTKEGHTATWGWYGVNKYTKKVYDSMNN